VRTGPGHGVEPDRGVRLRAGREFGRGQALAGMLSRQFVVLEIIFARHGRTYLPQVEAEVQSQKP